MFELVAISCLIVAIIGVYAALHAEIHKGDKYVNK